MPKKKIKKYRGIIINTSHEARNKLKTYYVEKFFNKFLSKYEFTGLNYQQVAFMMRQFWSIGSVAFTKYKGPDVSDDPFYQVCLTPWAPAEFYNIYNFPTKARAINLRGVSYVDISEKELDKDIVIVYIQKDHKGIYSNIEAMIEKLVDIEMTIRTNLKAQKTPWMFGVDSENENKMQNLWDNIDSDDPKLFVSLENLNTAKALVSGASYNIDKLEAQRQQCENEILTRLGIDNVGIMQKKEHFTVDEVNANNQQIQSSDDEYLEMMNEGFDRVLSSNIAYAIGVEQVECEMAEIEEQEDEENGNE